MQCGRLLMLVVGSLVAASVNAASVHLNCSIVNAADPRKTIDSVALNEDAQTVTVVEDSKPSVDPVTYPAQFTADTVAWKDETASFAAEYEIDRTTLAYSATYTFGHSRPAPVSGICTIAKSDNRKPHKNAISWQDKYFAKYPDISVQNRTLLKTGNAIPLGITWNEWVDWQSHTKTIMHHKIYGTDVNKYAAGTEVQLILSSWCNGIGDLEGSRQTMLYFRGSGGDAVLYDWQEIGC